MNKFKKTWNIVSTVIVVICVLCAVFLVGTRLLGYQFFTVLSGSMSPKYEAGDLLLVKECSPEDIKVGDPITFILSKNNDYATHRVIDIDAENSHFYTMGDANDGPDAAPVHFKNLVGKPELCIPLLGYVSNFIQTPPGTYYTIAIIALLIIVVFLPDFIFRNNEKKKDTDPIPENSSDDKNSKTTD